MVSLRTTSLQVLPYKGFAKNKDYRKSLQSLNREKGNHRSQKLSFVTSQTETFFFSISLFFFHRKESVEPILAENMLFILSFHSDLL